MSACTAHRACATLAAPALVAVALGVAADAARFPELPGATLQTGRALWVANCMTCHGYGIAGAPDPTDPKSWAARLQKPRETLYEHALNGFFGPGDTMMPARGGNAALSDEEVKRAVDYMTAVAALHQPNANQPDLAAGAAAGPIPADSPTPSQEEEP